MNKINIDIDKEKIMKSMNMNTVFTYVNMFEDMTKKFLSKEDQQTIFSSFKSVDRRIGNFNFPSYAPRKNAVSKMVSITNVNNYFEGQMSLELYLESIHILVCNMMAWHTQDNAELCEFFSNNFYTLRDKFLDNHSEEDNQTFLRFID